MSGWTEPTNRAVDPIVRAAVMSGSTEPTNPTVTTTVQELQS